MPHLCFPALEFPERRKVGKALMIDLPKWLDLRNVEPPLPQTQGAFSHPGPWNEAFRGPEVTRFLLFMVKAFAEQRKHSCQQEVQHNTCREGPGLEKGGGCQARWGPRPAYRVQSHWHLR